MDEYLQKEKERLLKKYNCKTIAEVIEKLENLLKTP